MNKLASERLTHFLRRLAGLKGTLPVWQCDPPVEKYREWGDEWLEQSAFKAIADLKSAGDYAAALGLAGEAQRLSDFHNSLLIKATDFGFYAMAKEGHDLTELRALFGSFPTPTGSPDDDEAECDRYLALIGKITRIAEFAGELLKMLASDHTSPLTGRRQGRKFSEQERKSLEDSGKKFLRQNPKATRRKLATHLKISDSSVSGLQCWKARNPPRKSNDGGKGRIPGVARIGLEPAIEEKASNDSWKRYADEQQRDAMIDRCPDFESFS